MNLKNLFRRSLDGEDCSCSSSKVQVEQPEKESLNAYTYNWMSVSAVHRCVTFLSENLALLPCNYVHLTDGIYTPTNSNLNYLLSVEPNSRMSAFSFWKAVVSSYLLHGEAFVLPRYVAGTNLISHFIPLKASDVSYNDTEEFYTINNSSWGIHERVSEADILHFVNYSEDGRRGRGFKHFAAQTASLLSLCDSKSKSDFSSADSFIKLKTESVGRLDIGEVNRAASKVQSDFGSTASVVVEPQFTEMTMVPGVKQSSSVIDTKKAAICDICRFFGLPESYLFNGTAENYKASEAAASQAISAIFPIIKCFELELNRKLVPTTSRQTSHFEFDTRYLYKYGEPNAKADFALKALQSGMLDLNDIRRMNNQPPVPGGDTPLVSANLITLDGLMAKVKSQVDAQGSQPNI